MEKNLVRCSNIKLIAGKAKPGANLSFLKKMMDFCKEFNKQSAEYEGPVMVTIKVFKTGEVTFQIKGTPLTDQLKIYTKTNKNGDKTISSDDLTRIAQSHMQYLNTDDLDKAKKIISGSVRSSKISVID